MQPTSCHYYPIRVNIILQASSPVCTELETVVTNWLGNMIGLPDDFLHHRSDSEGGGVLQVGWMFP